MANDNKKQQANSATTCGWRTVAQIGSGRALARSMATSGTRQQASTISPSKPTISHGKLAMVTRFSR